MAVRDVDLKMITRHQDENQMGEGSDDGSDESEDWGENRNRTRCRKHYMDRNKKTGGIFLFFCIHSICIGYHVMVNSEGRRDVAFALRRYWPVAPRYVVYDFACSCQKYVDNNGLNDDGFFDRTTWLIDNFHSMNHKCSGDNFLKNHRDIDGDLMMLRSSTAEVMNARLGLIKKSLRYMSQRQAFVLVQTFVGHTNHLKLNSLLHNKF